jgi:hypothetical protein
MSDEKKELPSYSDDKKSPDGSNPYDTIGLDKALDGIAGSSKGKSDQYAPPAWAPDEASPFQPIKQDISSPSKGKDDKASGSLPAYSNRSDAFNSGPHTNPVIEAGKLRARDEVSGIREYDLVVTDSGGV